MLCHQNRLAAIEHHYLIKSDAKAYLETVQEHNTLYRQVANKCISDLKKDLLDIKIRIGYKLIKILNSGDSAAWYAEAVKYEYLLDNGAVLELHRKTSHHVYVKSIRECVGCSKTTACTRTPNFQWVCRNCWA